MINTLLTALTRHARFLLCAAWFVALLHLLEGRTYERFLRPEFGFLLAFGLLAVLAFGAAEATRPVRTRKATFGGAIRGLLLLAPLLYMPITEGVSLDAVDFDKRWTGSISSPMTAGRASRPSPFRFLSGSSGQAEVTLLDLCLDAETYNGQTVELVGMVKQLPDVTETWGPEAMVLYRFVISCCVADAMPAAILLTGSKPDAWADDTWVRVKGRFTLEGDGEDALMRLIAETIEASKTPDRPYLF